MKYLAFAPGVLLAIGLALSACPKGAGGEGENDGGIQVVDGGFSGEGEGEGAAGEGEGEGEGGFQFCDGGLCPDSGIQGQEYSGTAEPGEKCDQAVCDIGTDCCVSFGAGFQLTATCGTAGQPCGQNTFATVACDGKEDCQANEECCFNSQTFSTSCVPAGTCEAGQNSNGSTVCVNTGDCVQGTELCCGLGANFQAPVDMGICQPAANNCQ